MQQEANDQEALLDTKAAAALLNIRSGTLEVWRSNRRYGLSFVRVGRSIRYRRSDLIAFIEARRVAEPTEPQAA